LFSSLLHLPFRGVSLPPLVHAKEWTVYGTKSNQQLRLLGVEYGLIERCCTQAPSGNDRSGQTKREKSVAEVWQRVGSERHPISERVVRFFSNFGISGFMQFHR
jgi:hypothetical protein